VVDFSLLAAVVVHWPFGLTPSRVSRADRPP
jgi:hypothetical protein